MRLHHVGVVVDDIRAHAARYAEYFGMQPLSETVADPEQNVKVQFLGQAGASGAAAIELIEPLPGDSPVRQSLQKGGGLSHLCFEVPDVPAAVEDAEARGAICVRRAVAAAAFEGRPIAFVFFRKIGLVEFVEAPAKLVEAPVEFVEAPAP
jgi:methylmalonyl-CoA/ethylmalonyl-CoA epimerase